MISVYKVYRSIYNQYCLHSNSIDKEKLEYYRNVVNMVADNYNNYINNQGDVDESMFRLDKI